MEILSGNRTTMANRQLQKWYEEWSLVLYDKNDKLEYQEKFNNGKQVKK
jgi:hypothetical protein